MGFARVLRAVGGTALAGALIFAVSPTPTASADQVRDAQWPLTAYSMDKVWQQSTGKGVTVAVIDSGVRATHQDLTGQVLPGIDYTHGGNGEHDYDTQHSHGTMMASLIAGHGHGPGDAEGVKGLAPGARILPIGSAIGTAHEDLSSAVYRGIRYAVDHHAGVINLSLGSPLMGSPQLDQAIGYAESHNVIVVAAAGNEGTDVIGAPADEPGVVAVGAVDKSAAVTDFSNYKGVALAAPGAGIVAAANGSDTQYRIGDGTSQSSALVSGTAALLRAKFPNLTAGQIINRMVKSANHSSNLAGISSKLPDAKYGYGISRPLEALTQNIPAGPVDGPLPQISNASGSGASDPATAPTKQAAGSSTGTIIGIVIGVVVLAAIVIAAIAISRRKKNNSGGPGGPAGPGAPGGQYPQYPQYGQPQQQPANPYQSGGENQPR
jgi:type VII secretion-associated serine protease mycosin